MPMAYQSRPRKRVHANLIRRAPDGSAFIKCESCGISVAVALADMHECGFKKNTRKKLRTQCVDGNVERHQPRSAFHLFIFRTKVGLYDTKGKPFAAWWFCREEFLKTCKDGNLIEKDKKGCERWKSMSKEERQPYVDQADKLDTEYLKLLWEEENEIQWVDEEADSAEVGIYDESYEDSEILHYDSKTSYGSGLFLSETYDTLDPKASLGMWPLAVQKFP